MLRYDSGEAWNRTAAWPIGKDCAQAADPVSERLVAHWTARCGHPHLGQCHRAADEMAGASPSCREPAGIKTQDGKVYLLTGEPGESINAKLAEYAAQVVTIKGRQSVRDGFAQLQVEEIRKL